MFILFKNLFLQNQLFLLAVIRTWYYKKYRKTYGTDCSMFNPEF